MIEHIAVDDPGPLDMCQRNCQAERSAAGADPTKERAWRGLPKEAPSLLLLVWVRVVGDLQCAHRLQKRKALSALWGNPWVCHGLLGDLSLSLLETAAPSSAPVTHCLMYKNISKMCQEPTLTSMKKVTSWMIHTVLFQTVKPITWVRRRQTGLISRENLAQRG